jgi:hypothetical protein
MIGSEQPLRNRWEQHLTPELKPMPAGGCPMRIPRLESRFDPEGPCGRELEFSGGQRERRIPDDVLLACNHLAL